MYLHPIERARRAFLLTVAQRDPHGHVARDYLEEKVVRIYKAETTEEIRNLLDLQSQRIFDNIMDESSAPRRP